MFKPNTSLPWEQSLYKRMTLSHYPETTIKTYFGALRRLSNYTNKTPDNLTFEEILEYQFEIMRTKSLSWSSCNINVCAFKFYYNHIGQLGWNFDELPYPKKDKRLPVVLSEYEVAKIIRCCTSPKHKGYILILYSTGLRVSEFINLKADNIDGDRNRIRIVSGKGRKDREIPLTDDLRVWLRYFYRNRQNKTSSHLFQTSHSDGGPIKADTINKIIKKSSRRAKLNKTVTAHTIRHTFATQHLENGVNIRQVQNLLGHANIRTTLIYAHIIEQKWAKIPCLLGKIKEQLIDSNSWESLL